jgi:hypothetical protein
LLSAGEFAGPNIQIIAQPNKVRDVAMMMQGVFRTGVKMKTCTADDSSEKHWIMPKTNMVSGKETAAYCKKSQRPYDQPRHQRSRRGASMRPSPRPIPPTPPLAEIRRATVFSANGNRTRSQ